MDGAEVRRSEVHLLRGTPGETVRTKREGIMSSTGRGAVRNENDFYATPESAFTPLLPFIGKVMIHGETVWEPACGDRRLINWMTDFGIMADGNDLNDEHGGVDYLRDMTMRYCVVTNPPFSLAFEFAKYAVERSSYVFLLLRLGFLASQKRREFFKQHEPSALFVLSERPSFTANGKTDSADYAWFFWGNVHRGIYHL